ncbi:MAG: hypothetical protein ACREBU_00495 [Nitrososphaera sp.]
MPVVDRVFDLAVLIVGVAILTLLIGQAGKTVQVVKGSASAFDQLLQTVTLQTGGRTRGY